MSRRLAVFATALLLSTGFLNAPPAAAAPPPVTAPLDDHTPLVVPPLEIGTWDGRAGVEFPADPVTRELIVEIAETHEEPEFREAAAAALASDVPDALTRFLTETHPRLQQQSDQRRRDTARQNTATIRAMAGTGVPGGYLETEIARVLRATDNDRAMFLAYGAEIARGRDEQAAKSERDRRTVLRERVAALVAAAPAESQVKRAAEAALAGDDAAVAAFWNGGYLTAANADAAAREQYLADLEARNKAAEELSELARRAARASEARRQLLIAHGNAIRELQRAANAMAGAANAARSAERILAGGETTAVKATRLAAARTDTAVQRDDAQQAADRARNAALAATAAADTLIDTGLQYGAEWSLIVQGMQQAAVAAVGSATTALHAVDATIATNNAQSAEARAAAHADQAVKWRAHAEQHALAAAKLAAAARAQATAAKTAAARAKTAREQAQAAEARAWAAAARTRQHRITAETEAAAARDARIRADQERATAATHRKHADEQAAVAAGARRNAQAQAATAATARQRADSAKDAAVSAQDTAWEHEGTARRARDAATRAELSLQAAEAKAQALRAWAAATPAGEAKVEAERQADAAAREAQTARGAARAARTAANTASGAAANAQAEATETQRAADRAEAAAAESRAAAVRADAAADRAEAEAKATHQARLEADARAAEATAQQARAAEAARAAVRLAEQAADEAVQSLWAAQRTKAEADAATTESVAAAAQAEIAVTAAAAARASSAGIAEPLNNALGMVSPFTGADIDADFVVLVAEQARTIGAEQAAAATARAAEALTAARRAEEAAALANGQVKPAFEAAAEAARQASDAATAAAEAKQAAAAAARDGAAARSAAEGAGRADAQAKADARTARSAANAAADDAALAGRSAASAQQEANSAAGAARTAARDAADARDAATTAEADATTAERAATTARAAADSAATAAANALQHAIDAQAAAERAEETDRRRRALTLAAQVSGNPPALPAPEQLGGLTPEQRAQLQSDQALAGMSVWDFLASEDGELLKELTGLAEFEACFGNGDIMACLWAAVGLIPGPRVLATAFKLAKLAPKIQNFIERAALARDRIDDLLEIAERAQACQIPNSFLAGTPILLADGRTVPIEDVPIGAKVLATDPETNRTAARPVTDVVTDRGVKKLVDLTIKSNGRTATLTAADSHPFWAPDARRWIDAEDLRPGSRLRTEVGGQAEVTAVKARTARVTVHNLSVGGFHTFYAQAGAFRILVHNCGAKVVDLYGNEITNPDPLAGKLRDFTNDALRRWENNEIGFSAKDQARIDKNPNLENAIKGNILDAEVKRMADDDPSLAPLFSTPNGYPGPDWANTGPVPLVGWYDLTTTKSWGQHVYDYGPRYGPGVGILWQ
ncbi:Hint domain-containing protein [Actinoplanes sp. CA-051413]|uniref:Hint domain-containing protein n=1 Tax=Actinoplanes sp. CA-051413 TaxID=3239899 RepID=UPI003D967176